MGKVGEKQKRRPKFKDKKQSERFKQAARELDADESNESFDKVIQQMAKKNREAEITLSVPSPTTYAAFNRSDSVFQIGIDCVCK